CALALYALRFYLTLILGMVFFLGLLLAGVRSRSGTDVSDALARQFLLTGVIVAAAVCLGYAGTVKEVLPMDVEEGLQRMQSSRVDLAATARSGYLHDVDITNPFQAALFLPVGMLYFLTVPWPWELGSFRQSITVPETAFWVLLYIPVFFGVRAG